jgi:hypothetical protein
LVIIWPGLYASDILTSLIKYYMSNNFYAKMIFALFTIKRGPI